MLPLDLYRDRQGRRYLAGLNSEAEAVLPEFPQGDTIAIAIHNIERNTDGRASLYAEKPWSFTSIRASVGLIDAAADSGSFKLTVGAESTTALAWPASFADAAAIAAWKASVLAALKALPGIADDAIVASDPADAPAHFLFFTWTGDADDREITVTANRLAPVCLPRVTVQRGTPGFQTCIQLVQAPITLATEFAFVDAPAATIAHKRTGAVGANAVQRITPPAAPGALEVRYLGAPTSFLQVPGMTAASLAAALNALTAEPSFAVTAAGAAFDVEFIGLLAAAPQALLAVAFFPAVPPTVALGLLPLTSPRFERALNGAASARLQFELVIEETGGESKIIREVTLVNAMTSGTIVGELEDAGVVLTVTETVVVDESMMTPFASVAPGATFTPPSALGAGVAQTVNHGLGTLTPRVWVEYQSSLDPEQWRELQLGGEFDWHSTNANNLSLTLAYTLTDTPEDDFYKGRFKVFVASPDAVLEIFANLTMTWEQCLESLPDGESVAEKFAAIDAALGMFGGTLRISAGAIDGQIGPSQIDIEALATALKVSPQFLETLRTLVTDAALIDAIGTALAASATFLSTFKTLITRDDVLSSIATALTGNAAFIDAIRTLFLNLIQGTQPRDSILIRIADLDTSFPTLLAGGTPAAPLYPTLPAVRISPDDLGDITGYAPRASSTNAGKFLTVDGVAHLAPHRRKTFADGDVIFSDGFDWWKATVDGVEYYAAEFDRQLFAFAVNDAMLGLGTRFALAFAFTLSLAGNCDGYYLFELKRGTAESDGAGPVNLETVTWDETVISQPIVIADAAVTHNFAYTVTRPADEDDDLVATKQSYLGTAGEADVPADPRFVLLAQLTHFDVSDVARPIGQVRLTMKAVTASIVKL